MMTQIVGIVRNPSAWLALSLTIAFITISVFTWRAYVRPVVNPDYVPNCEFNGACRMEERANPTIMYFYTTWCPHCKTARPEWDRLRNWAIGRKINGRVLSFVEVDCDQDKSTADEFDVDSYPTVKLVSGSRVVDFDAKPSFESLRDFVNSEL